MGRVRAVPRFCELYLGICLTTEEKARKNLSQGNQKSASWHQAEECKLVTRYGLDGPGIESRWGRDISHPSGLALGPTQPPIQWVPSLSGV